MQSKRQERHIVFLVKESRNQQHLHLAPGVGVAQTDVYLTEAQVDAGGLTDVHDLPV